MTRQQQLLAGLAFEGEDYSLVHSTQARRPPSVWEDSQWTPAAVSLQRRHQRFQIWHRSHARAVLFPPKKHRQAFPQSSLLSPLFTASCKNHTYPSTVLLTATAYYCINSNKCCNFIEDRVSIYLPINLFIYLSLDLPFFCLTATYVVVLFWGGGGGGGCCLGLSV